MEADTKAAAIEPVEWRESRNGLGSWTKRDGSPLSVDVAPGDGVVYIGDSEDDIASCPVEDIPWLIQALTEAQQKLAEASQ